ncbi:alpha/beta hydrolase [Phenylobacterium sp.]|jgi:phospholipase/carboxylesterase|uniref:alpha/beta hydrolase n=1 Tax=Phenylobacterium sp. TaxID=1871053 RepID=UPI002F3F0064
MAGLGGPQVAPASGGAPKQIVVLLHGYGSNGEDLIGLAPYWREALPDALMIAPDAPEPCPGVPGGRQWWPLADMHRDALAAGVRGAAPALDGFLDALLSRHGLSEDKMALVGFSQGTMMALHVGPRRVRRLAGVLGYSGALPDAPELAVEIRSHPPVLLVHGKADSVVPLAAFQHARDALTDLGFELETHLSPGLDHSIDLPGLQAGEAFLKRIFA